MQQDNKGRKPTEKRQFNVYLPPELIRRLKHHAIDHGDSLSSLVERIFKQYLDRNRGARE